MDSSSSSLQCQSALEAVCHRRKGTVRLAERRDTRGSQRIELATAATSLRSGLADPRFQKALVLEPIECGVDGVDRYVPARAGVNLLSDRGSVRGFLELETCHTKKDELFEIAESRRIEFRPHGNGAPRSAIRNRHEARGGQLFGEEVANLAEGSRGPGGSELIDDLAVRVEKRNTGRSVGRDL